MRWLCRAIISLGYALFPRHDKDLRSVVCMMLYKLSRAKQPYFASPATPCCWSSPSLPGLFRPLRASKFAAIRLVDDISPNKKGPRKQTFV